MIKKLPVILIVSDRLTIQHTLTSNLEEDYHIIDKESFNQAIEVAKNTQLDFVIIDSNLKEADPIELIFQLRKKERLILTPILLITKSLKKAYREKAKKVGANDFLHDPLDSKELNLVLDECKQTIHRNKKVSNLSDKIKLKNKKITKNLSNRIKKGKVK